MKILAPFSLCRSFGYSFGYSHFGAALGRRPERGRMVGRSHGFCVLRGAGMNSLLPYCQVACEVILALRVGDRRGTRPQVSRLQ